MNSKLVLLAVAWSLPLPALLSEDAPPQPPFFQPPPARSSWAIAAAESSAEGGPRRLVRRNAVQSGDLRQELDTWSDGQRTETWIIHGMWIVGSSDGGLTLIDPARDLSVDVFYGRYEFSKLSWLSADTYVGTETRNGHARYHFKKGGRTEPPAADDSAGFAGSSVEVWVDVETRLVEAVKTGATLYTVTYGNPAADPVLPPRYADLWQGYQATANPLSLQQPPSR